jgi:hypothetical protein
MVNENAYKTSFLVATTYSRTATVVLMLETETLSIDLAEEDMLAVWQKNSNFVIQGEFWFPRPNFC